MKSVPLNAFGRSQSGRAEVKKLRDAGINAEIYPESGKVKKQFDYANRKNIPFVVVVGSDEIQTGELTLKNMTSGEQEKLNIEQIIEKCF